MTTGSRNTKDWEPAPEPIWTRPGRIFPRAFRGSAALLKTWFQLLASGTGREAISVVLSHPLLGTVWWPSQESNPPGRVWAASWCDLVCGKLLVSGCSGCYNKIPKPGCLKQQTQSLEVQDQGAGWFGLLSGPHFWLVGGRLLAVSSHGFSSQPSSSGKDYSWPDRPTLLIQ